MKQYIAPSIEINKFTKKDIIATSDLPIINDTVDDYQSREFILDLLED